MTWVESQRYRSATPSGLPGGRTCRRGLVAAASALMTAMLAIVSTGGTAMASPAVSPSAALSSFGDAGDYGAPTAGHLNQPVVGMAATPDGGGYWLVAADGGVFSFGDARFYGSEGGAQLNQPVVGMAATPDGGAYWLVAADGGVFSFGDARFSGSEGGAQLNQPVVGMAANPSGGYWLVAADGGVFSFGNAPFYGSEGGSPLGEPVVGMAADPSGGGYWMVADDGGVFSFGAARFYGSDGGSLPSEPIVGLAPTADGSGYWLASSVIDQTPASTAVPEVVADCNQLAPAPSSHPISIVLACGDGNASLVAINWPSWDSTTAVGTGTYTQNDCTPDCALGTFISYPGTTIELSSPWKTFAGYEFSSVTFTFPDAFAPGGLITRTQSLEITTG